VIGEDWGSKSHNLEVESYLKASGKQIVQVRYNPQNSSTKIKQRVIAQPRTDMYITQTAA
jgi:glycerol-3-phosphate cytidylyltransferase